MALAPGNFLGPYEVTAQIGVGGMGEVYRATDTSLKRAVAIKVLPEAVAGDADRLARFQREAEVVASLNHPHIAAIYGLERSGGFIALVMELVEGPTLADRIAQGPLPLDEALPIARQMAEALAAAHEQWIIHRDLKPANIKVRDDGTVKVLDFGLAKALEPAATGNVSMSPTLSLAATQAGMILGTAAYMAPEQARGKPADKRADIWAFGCVLYEMLAGRRAFDGEDVAVVLAAVIRGEPDWTALPGDVPTPIVTLLRGCLEKDRQSRIGDIGTATFVLTRAAQLVESAPVAAPHPTAAPRALWRRASPMIAGVGIGAVLAGTVMWVMTQRPPPSVVRTTISTSGSAALTVNGTDRDVAVTPDGSRVVYRGKNQLLVRALDQLEPTVLSGLGAPRGVFISPNGQWVGFFDGPALKKVPITGGPPTTLCAIEGNSRGATWRADGTIIFATSATATGLQRVSAEGGEPATLTTPDRRRGERDHVWPELLPGGGAVLYTIIPDSSGVENSQIAVLDLRTNTSKVLFPGGSHAHYVPTGHLIYGVAGTLRAVAFDLDRLEVIGTPEPVVEDVLTTAQGAADAAVAANGSLVYVPRVGGGGGQTVVSVDREGRSTPFPGLPADAYRDVRVSPNGAQLALATDRDVSTYDIRLGALSRLTSDPAPDRSPLWTPDGLRIIFTSLRAGYAELFWRPADGTGSDRRFLTRATNLTDLLANGWSPDGGQLLFTDVPPNLQCAIGQLPVDPPADAKPLVSTEFCNAHAAVSPNGRWLAYRSRSGGRDEIYVERYPALGGRKQISNGGGTVPVWSTDGGELFFVGLDGRQMFSVAVPAGATFAPGRPQLLFEFAMSAPEGGARPYDITKDGRFVIIRSGQADAGGSSASNLIIVQNWTEELKRLVPVN